VFLDGFNRIQGPQAVAQIKGASAPGRSYPPSAKNIQRFIHPGSGGFEIAEGGRVITHAYAY
jgi:hypothetical protein